MRRESFQMQLRLARLCCGFLAAMMVLGLAAGTPLLLQPAAAAPPTVSAANTQLVWEATSPQGAPSRSMAPAPPTDATQFQWWIACTTQPPCAGGTLLGSPRSSKYPGHRLAAPLPSGPPAPPTSGLSPRSSTSLSMPRRRSPTPVIDNYYDATSPQGASVTLNGSGSTGAATYSWSANRSRSPPARLRPSPSRSAPTWSP